MSDMPMEVSPRLQQFQSDMEQLKVTGGKVNPERSWGIFGIVLMVAGAVITLVAWLATRGTIDALEIADYSAMAMFGLTVAIVGSVVFAVMSLRRYLRYWLIRLIYEQRDQTDRVISSGR